MAREDIELLTNYFHQHITLWKNKTKILNDFFIGWETDASFAISRINNDWYLPLPFYIPCLS